MSAIYFITLPLLFGFITPIFSKIGKSVALYVTLLMQLFLFALALTLLLNNTPHPEGTSHVEIISIAPPLGISFVLNQASLLFVALFTFLFLMFGIYYLSYRQKRAYKNEEKFLILVNMLLASTIGLVLSSDIFNIYVFFEIAGISAYILSAYEKSAKALEAGIKYLLTGAIASIFLVFAIFLIYINLGTLNLALISESFSALSYPLKTLILILLLLGFGFKVEIFPLNLWVSDVYEGSSTPINALFSAVVVKAYLFVFFHILYLFLSNNEFSTFLIYLGALSMLVAELSALRQTNLKRLFAYSSLGQVGLIFAVFASQNKDAIDAALFIVVAHSLAKMSIFLSISTIEKNHNSVNIDILKRIDSPFIKFTMIVAMLSLLGFPIFAGFIGKFLALKSFALSGAFLVIAILLIASIIESVYYFKLMKMLLSTNVSAKPLRVSLIEKGLFLLFSTLIVLIGVYPMSISEYITHSSESMLDSLAYVHTLLGAAK